MRRHDVPLSALHITNPQQKVWCRQFNPETYNAPKIINQGGTLWFLGLKTEFHNTIITASKGAYTEVLGAHIYAQGNTKTRPMIINNNSHISIAGLRQFDFHNPSRHFEEMVKETRNGTTKILRRKDQGDFLTLYTGYEKHAVKRAIHTPAPALNNSMPGHPLQSFTILGRKFDYTPCNQASMICIRRWGKQIKPTATVWLP
jgi:hypothetical protein